MKKFITLSIMLFAFITNAMAWEPVIKEIHWFGQYEYLDIHPLRINYTNINWSDNYLESIEIEKDWTGQNPLQHPVTSYYSWLEHQLRFSVESTDAWTIGGVENSAYYTDRWSETSPGSGQYSNNRSYGQGLKNDTWQNQKFYIHNLKAGDEYKITYYENNGNAPTVISASATGTATVSIPGQAVIRSVEIKLAEYVASDFKVEEVKGQYVTDLTSSHNTFLRNNGVTDAQFGDLGYRYSFKGPGVLEDKRGAAPYITMKFGNDNDMTFVRSLADVTYTYGNLKQVTPKMFTKNGGQSDDEIVASTPDENGVYVVQSKDNPAEEWDTQFWIGTTEYNLPAGQKFKIKFDYMADAAAEVHTQTHGGNHGPYIHWACIGDLNFTTGWQTFEREITIENDMVGWQSVAFNLNVLTSATNYYFRNIELSIPERTENIGDEDYGAASIIHESNDLDPDKEHLQYRWTFKDGNYGDRFSEAEIRDRLVGKEWSTFTAHHATEASSGVHPSSSGEDVNGVNYIYGDEFSTIWPLCGNFFYFFPEVDGLLEIDYYCEGSNETNAFWYKQDAEGNLLTVPDQPNVQFINANGQNISNRTDGTNNYKMMVNVEKGGIYYLCSLPTNMTHERPIFRLKSYTFIPRFRVAPLYKVVHNSEVNSEKTVGVAKIIGGPYTDLNGGQPGGYGNNSYELTGTFTRNAEPEARVKCLGNVVSATAKVEMINGEQCLSFYNIKFRQGTNPETGEAYNPGGAVVAHVNNEMGQASFVLTIAYDAADAEWNDDKTQRVAVTTGGKEVKRWDFYSGKGDYNENGVINDEWDLGKYNITKNAEGQYEIPESDKTWFKDHNNTWANSGKSKLFKEVNKADGLTTDWEFDYVDVPNQKEPLFKSIYDMEGDNADMIHETAGLVFLTEPNELGVWNENEAPSTSSFQDRFVGLMGGGKLIIPFLQANDRIVIKMGTFGNADSDISTHPATLTITNAKDALGRDITSDYKIGGSGVELSNSLEDEESEFEFTDKSKPYGEYHFISSGGDFILEVKDADLLKFYSIEIYKHDNTILSENQVKAESDKPYILNVKENNTKDHAYLHVNHRGQGEPSTYHLETRKTGTITQDDVEPDSDNDDKDGWFNYAVTRASNPADAKFGIFKTRLGVLTLESGLYNEDSHAYVTDYAESMIPVGYRQTMEYPYTWDFTDLRAKYVSAGISSADGKQGNEVDVNETGYDNSPDLKIWNGYNMRVSSDEYDGYIFAPGSQIYGGKTMFDEARGIGIIHNGENGAMSMTNPGAQGGKGDGGLAVSSGNTFEFVVPQVPKDAGVYVHVRKVNGASSASVKSRINKATTINDFTYTGTDSKGDEVFMLKNAALGNVNICVQGYEVNKIAVATDEKKTNIKGYASESREHAIDASLLPYFTGKKMKSYLVSDPDYKEHTLTLTDVSTSTNSYVIPENTGYVIYNPDNANDTGEFNPFWDGEEETITDKGFHLFVPDMHDQTGKFADVGTNNEFMVPVLEERTGTNKLMSFSSDGKKTNYVLSYKWYDLKPDGSTTGKQHEGDEMFYRVSKEGINLRANSAYLVLDTESLGLKTSQGSVQDTTQSAKFTFVFSDWSDAPVVPTTIENHGTMETFENGNVEWHNLSGQKLNGKPSVPGLYIVNGKKVLVK